MLFLPAIRSNKLAHHCRVVLDKAGLLGACGLRRRDQGLITEADGEDPAVCPGCPLARVNHALAMNEKEIENHFDEIHYELQAYKKLLDSFKEDLK
jgi:hypothetical protein